MAVKSSFEVNLFKKVDDLSVGYRLSPITVSGTAIGKADHLTSRKRVAPIISSPPTSAQLNDRVVGVPSDPVWLMTGLEPVPFHRRKTLPFKLHELRKTTAQLGGC